MPVGVSAYVPLANITLGSSAASVTFSSINQAYRDLVLVANPVSSVDFASVLLDFNNSFGSGFSRVFMSGDGSSAYSLSQSSSAITYSSYLMTGQRGTYIVNVLDYSATDKHKTILSKSNNSSVGVDFVASRWSSNSAVSSLGVNLSNGGVFTAGSTFALYGIAS